MKNTNNNKQPAAREYLKTKKWMKTMWWRYLFQLWIVLLYCFVIFFLFCIATASYFSIMFIFYLCLLCRNVQSTALWQSARFYLFIEFYKDTTDWQKYRKVAAAYKKIKLKYLFMSLCQVNRFPISWCTHTHVNRSLGSAGLGWHNFTRETQEIKLALMNDVWARKLVDTFIFVPVFQFSS